VSSFNAQLSTHNLALFEAVKDSKEHVELTQKIAKIGHTRDKYIAALRAYADK
jgi:hypothetical protein